MTKAVAKKREKPYSKPILTTYGSVRELTKALVNTGQLDGGTPSRRTHA